MLFNDMINILKNIVYTSKQLKSIIQCTGQSLEKL